MTVIDVVSVSDGELMTKLFIIVGMIEAVHTNIPVSAEALMGLNKIDCEKMSPVFITS